jgi:hypothetical protein
MSRLKRLIMLIACLWIGVTQAILITDLYETSVSVTSRDTQERQQALALALQQVLIKVSGSTVEATHSQLRSAMENPDAYVKLFQYREVITDGTTDPAKKLQLEVQFQPNAVNALATRMKLPIWPANRPLTMMWLAMEAPTQPKHLLGTETDPELMEQLQTLAKTWGIPLAIPVLDLAEVSQITVAEVWEQSPATVQQASIRYGSDALLMGRLTNTENNSWKATWKLVIHSETESWDTQAADFSAILQTGLQGLAERLVPRFSMQTQHAASEGILIEVVALSDYPNYLQLMRYLQQLPQVRSVRVVRLTGDICALWVVPSGDTTAFKQAVALDRHLVPMSGPESEAGALRYRFLP